MFTWDSKQYVEFVNERTQPAVDLVSRIQLSSPDKIVDIGCGPGNSTHVLSERFPHAHILGVDSSEDMIQTAQKTYPSLHFRKCDARTELSGLGNDLTLYFPMPAFSGFPAIRH
ncbi:MAG: methyltransferase domain-containing protein [Treponema sp.]